MVAYVKTDKCCLGIWKNDGSINVTEISLAWLCALPANGCHRRIPAYPQKEIQVWRARSNRFLTVTELSLPT